MANEGGLLFDRVAADYDRARPAYPEALVDLACEAAGLAEGARVVEVGCGTGKLTASLAARGLRVEAVDPGSELVGIARRRIASDAVCFHVGRFEDIDIRVGSFAAVFSATAFHWVDPAVSWAKAAALLRPHGVLSLVTHVGGWFLELEPRLLTAWREVLPAAAGWVSREPQEIWDGAEARRDNVAELWAWLTKCDLARPEAADLFERAELTAVPIAREDTLEQALTHLRTQSAYLALDVERRQRLEQQVAAVVADAGGIYRSTTFATLVTARLQPAS